CRFAGINAQDGRTPDDSYLYTQEKIVFSAIFIKFIGRLNKKNKKSLTQFANNRIGTYLCITNTEITG
ncbi:MAG: hypothetical protein K8F30_04920, partial [Taibaiella sp.]|nr:hypothetical protein [Taibaiella sp.]